MNRIVIVLVLTAVCCFQQARAEVVARTITYRSGDDLMEGYLAYDDALEGKRPAVMLVHEWTGIGDYVKGRVEQLAGMGYLAFAADIYGKGIRPVTRDEAAAQASIYRDDRALMRERALAGLNELRQHELADKERVAALGYCFGGGVVLELARAGADVRGVVSFHGNLDTPDPADAENIKAKVLVLHGAADPYVPAEQVTAFEKEMNEAGVDWYLVSYGNAVHSFTNPSSGDDPSSGAAYNEKAEERSWRAMQAFFNEIF